MRHYYFLDLWYRRDTISWPPRFLDLNPLDYFVWEYLKERVYYQKINSEAFLRNRIFQAAIELRRVMTQKATERKLQEMARACFIQKRWTLCQLLQ